MTGFSAQSRAKINLSLRIVGSRFDGYHLLQSLIAFANVGDILRAEPNESITLDIYGPYASGLSHGPENIVMRAAYLLRDMADISDGAAIMLEKHLPVASGIGGGSGDAATIIPLLCQLWGLTLSARDKQDLANHLGADVAVCLYGKAAWMEGIGEIIHPIVNFPSCAVVLINPLVPLSTAEVFRTYHDSQQAFSLQKRLPETFVTFDELLSFLSEEDNDLTQSACTLLPAIHSRLEALTSQPGIQLARVSGSGATCFGLCATLSEAKLAAATMQRLFPTDWVAASEVYLPTAS